MMICKKTGKMCIMCRLSFIDDISKCENLEHTEEQKDKEQDGIGDKKK